MLTATTAELDGSWLKLHCCGGVTVLPVRRIVQCRGGAERLGAVLARLSCHLCKGKPVRAYLNETHNRLECGGSAPGWSVQLIPALDDQAEAA